MRVILPSLLSPATLSQPPPAGLQDSSHLRLLSCLPSPQGHSEATSAKGLSCVAVQDFWPHTLWGFPDLLDLPSPLRACFRGSVFPPSIVDLGKYALLCSLLGFHSLECPGQAEEYTDIRRRRELRRERCYSSGFSLFYRKERKA